MSRKNLGGNTPVGAIVGYGYAYVVLENTVDAINGRMYQLIETLGLPDKQEEAIKGLIRGATWNVFEDAIRITPERHTEIRTAWFKRREEIGNTVPMSAI